MQNSDIMMSNIHNSAGKSQVEFNILEFKEEINALR